MKRDFLKHCRRIVIKAGTSMLTGKSGRISLNRLGALGDQIQELIRRKKEVALVSSGAIAFGMEACNMQTRPKLMAELQACAAIGQGRMMHAYENFFSKKKRKTSQILLTRDGLEKRDRFLAARNTFEELFKMKVLPIINENDTIATEEIAFGDNDILSVHVAHLVHAELLIILSDVNGFYLQDGTRVPEVHSEQEIDQKLVQHLKDYKKEKTVGGMRAKLEAARVAMRLGVPIAIVSGRDENILTKMITGEDVGTVFLADRKNKNARKNWIAYSVARKGVIVVDQGAYEALQMKKRSLLPSGIIKIKGAFIKGQMVELENSDGIAFGRGLVRYSSKELGVIAGKKTHEIQSLLGYKYHDEAIHRDDLVIWNQCA